MSIIHFLNVNEGDCIWIKHHSERNTVIDISNGNDDENISEGLSNYDENISEVLSLGGNHNQKKHPVNPIKYLEKEDVRTIFRFILTHPDMDHMDGIKNLFDAFKVVNFWDTKNTKEINDDSVWGKYNKADWDFYQKIRKSSSNCKILNLYAGAKGRFYNQPEEGNPGGDGLYILAPTKDLVEKANESEEYNDCSYVILYKTENNKKIIFAGDSAEKTWNYILENYEKDVTDIDVLIAPHHGRKTGGNDEYLDVLNPKLTLFGNAKSKNLNYSSWSNRKYITNNQANCIIIDTNGRNGMDVYVTYEKFAKKCNPYTFYNNKYDGWYLMTIEEN